MAIFPKSLFWRFWLIIIIPIVMIQVITAYIFYQRHWENVNQHMERALISEIYTLTKFIENTKNNNEIQEILKKWSDLFTLDLKPTSQEYKTDKSSEFLEEFNQSLSTKLRKPTTSYYLEDLRTIRSEIEVNDRLIILDFSSKRLHSSTTYIFILWMLGTSILLAIISLIFMKNQLRSIVILAQAAEEFGKGRNVDNFHPTGAREVRIAGLAFIRMKKSLERQIKYRTDLLTHISHDLRTPITRMKLQLELIEDSKAKTSLNKNLDEMQEMLTHYLNFAKGEGNEEAKKINLAVILEEVIYTFDDARIKLILKKQDVISIAKENAIKRAISNLVNNSIKFATEKIIVTLNANSNEIMIAVEDDGDGIPENMLKEALKPFFQINKEKEGFGLGLAITKTIVNAHGGFITLSKSKLGGLKALISLPN